MGEERTQIRAPIVIDVRDRHGERFSVQVQDGLPG